MKIFIVDDDPMDRMFICNALRNQGADLTLMECENGRQAVEETSNTEPVYALVDIRMPGLNGFETCAAIRTNRPERECHLRVLTTSSATDDHDTAIEHGADAVHVKPATSAEYADLARAILADWNIVTQH